MNTDQSIIDAILNGDTKSYTTLVNRYKDLVFTLALRMLKNREEAEEVAQDAFIKAFKSLERFKGDSKFSTWIYKITYNTCLDKLKKNKKHFNDRPIDAYTEYKLETIDNALEHMIAEEKTALIRRCVNKLSSENSYLITLYYFDELSLDEISAIIGIKANAVKVKLFRARKKLAVILGQHMQEKTI